MNNSEQNYVDTQENSPYYLKVLVKSFPTNLLRETINSIVTDSFNDTKMREIHFVDWGVKDSGKFRFQIWNLYDTTPEQEIFMDDSLNYHISGTDVAIFNFPKNDLKMFEKARKSLSKFKQISRKQAFVLFVGVKEKDEIITARESDLFVEEMNDVRYVEIKDNPEDVERIFDLIITALFDNNHKK